MARRDDCVFAPNPVPDGYVEQASIPLVLRPARLPRQRDRRRRASTPTRSPTAPRYREITAPTVVISGDRDTVVYEEIHSLGLARDIPGAELVWVHNLGHKPDWIAPELVVAAVEKIAGRPRDLQAMARQVEARIAADALRRRHMRRRRKRAERRNCAPLPSDASRCYVQTGHAVRADIGDAQHVGRAGRAQRHAGGDDDAVAQLAEALLRRRSGRRGRPCRRGRWRRA